MKEGGEEGNKWGRRRHNGKEAEAKEEERELGLGKEDENSTHSLACKFALFNQNSKVGNSLLNYINLKLNWLLRLCWMSVIMSSI